MNAVYSEKHTKANGISRLHAFKICVASLVEISSTVFDLCSGYDNARWNSFVYRRQLWWAGNKNQ